MSSADAQQLSTRLAAVSGVREVVVLPDESMLMLKVDLQHAFDEAEVLRLIED